MTDVPGSGEPWTPELERQVDALSRRFAALSEQVSAIEGPPAALATKAVEDLAAAVEELEVGAEELHAQNEALTAAQELRDIEAARYHELFDLAPDGYLVTDSLGVIVEANVGAVRLFGSTERRLLGKPVIVFLGEADRRVVLDHISEAATWRAGAVVELELWCAPPDSPPFPASVRLTSSVSPPGCAQKQRIRWLVRDVTERETARLALQTALLREREASIVLRDANAAKDSILLAVAHDLRTPVTAASGLAELLLDRLADLSLVEIRKLGEGIASSTRQLTAMLNNLLDVQRLAGGHTVVHPERVDLTALVGSCADALELTETAASVPTEPIYADVDPGLTTRIVSNLLSNAIRHASGGAPPRLRITETNGAVTISVDDDGPGVADDLKVGLFEAFERPTGAAGAGLGLGLYLVRRFAELQRGRAWVEDRAEGGASFRVRLPVSSAQPDVS